MAAIILGKNLLPVDELIEFAFSHDNVENCNVHQLTAQASDAALYSSLLLIRMMKVERIYVETSAIKGNASPASKT